VAVRLPIIALATALLVSILPAASPAQTAFGELNVWLKQRASADAPNEENFTMYRKSMALVIGMDHYTGGWPPLSNGIKDAEEVKKALEAQGFEVTFKTDLKSRDLEDALRNFFVVNGDYANARLLLWFAGHGHTTIDGEAYLVPVDAPLPRSKFDPDFRLKAISLRRFGELMREAKSRHVLAIFDSCFSGGVFNVARSAPPPPAITLATTEPVREFISSGQAEQVVSDDGTFRKLFLDALAGKEPDADANHDGYVTGTELGLFLQQKMSDLTSNRQTPRYGKLNDLGYDRGDFVFQVGKPDVPSPVPPRPSFAEVAQLCESLASNPSVAVVQSLMESYKGTPIAACAQARLDELRSQVAPVQPPVAAPQQPKSVQDTQVALVAPPVVPTPPAISSGPCSSAPVTVSLSSRSAEPLSAAEECSLKPKDVFQECDKCPEMIVVPSGSFTMGSPGDEPERSFFEDQVEVTIARAFAVGRFAVTFDEWGQCVTDGGCDAYKPSDQGWGRGRRPVINVSWNDAQNYVGWLSHKTGKTYRLLSEAEREYVTRAGTTTPFWWGSSITPKQANYAGGSEPYKGGGNKGEYRNKTVPVDSFSPNPWGSTTSTATCMSGRAGGNCSDRTFAAAPGSTLRIGCERLSA
jgi:formylglycine-generating enzyme required for sulfatase activity